MRIPPELRPAFVPLGGFCLRWPGWPCRIAGPRLCSTATLLFAALLALSPLHAADSNSLLDISADGRLLACANRDNGTVSIVDLEQGRVLHEVPVGHKPEAVTFLGSGHALAATVYADDKVVFLDADRGRVTGEVAVEDEPYGIVADSGGGRVYITLDYPGQVIEVDVARREVLRTLPATPFSRGIAIAHRAQRLYVTGYFSGSVVAVDLGSGGVVDRWPGLASENLARQITLHPTRPKAYVPHIRSRVNVNRGEGSVVPFLSVVDTAAGEGRRRKPVPMDAFYGTFVVANPWEAAVSPDGKLLCAVFSGTDDMYVCDVIDDDYRELAFKKLLNLGHNPRAVRFTPDGRAFYVYNTLDFSLTAFSVETLRPTAQITVCKNPLGEEVLQGKILFYSALQPMVGRRWISCSSCHPDGDGDARTWQNPEGLRNTTALFGMAFTHPLHWSADRDETQDFEHTIRSPLMQGRGLIRGEPHPSLDQPNGGRSAALDALAAYSNTHHVPLSPHAKQGLSVAAQRGKDLFFNSATGCATCHTGPFYTDSTPAKPYHLHDVGTGDDDPTEKMGPKYDTPTLLGVYRTGPYLHHGKAQSLAEVLTKYNRHDRHGKTSQLTAGQVADMVEFLKALPYEDPEPQAATAGVIKIER